MYSQIPKPHYTTLCYYSHYVNYAERERERGERKGGGGGGDVPGNSPGVYMQVPIQHEEVAIETINVHHSTWYGKCIMI